MPGFFRQAIDVEPRLVAWAVALSLTVSILATYWEPVQLERSDAGGSPRLGSEAPAVSLRRLDGQTADLDQLRGKPVVLNFWATWCPPCRAEMPELDALSRERGDISVLAVDVQEDVVQVERFQAELALTLPIALDSDGQTWAIYRTRGLPTTFLIDGAGMIRDINIGPLTRALLESKLERLK